MARAKHRKKSNTVKNVQRAAVTTGIAVVAVGATTNPAMAAVDVGMLKAIADCESGDRLANGTAVPGTASNVPNSSGASSAEGFWQIVRGTWVANGGLEFAPTAMGATYEEQLTVATRIAENRGSFADWNASKSCWGNAAPSPGPAAQAPAPVAPAPVVETPAPIVETVSGGQRVVNEAKKYIGTPYVWGGSTPSGFDCSGLVQFVFKGLGVNLERTSAVQAKTAGTVVNGMENAQVGDLLFFDSDKDGKINHVGIYSGNNKMIDAPRTGKPVAEREVWMTPNVIRHVEVPGTTVEAPQAIVAETPAVVESPAVSEEAPAVTEQAPVVSEPAPVENEEVQETSTTYTVTKGDWLNKIAPRFGTTWRELYEDNREVIGDNPNLIYPGQVFFVGGLPLAKAPVTVPDEAVEVDDKDPIVADLDCKDIASYDEAQAILSNDTADPHNLDANDNGEACEVWFGRAETAAVVVVEKAEEVSAASNVLVPGGRFTSGFGARWGTQHKGIDLAAPVGTPIYTPLGGTVTTADFEWHGGFGAVVYLKADNGDTLWFGHMSKIDVAVGQRVEAGEKIAEVGDRGTSTGPHLHFEVHDKHLGAINPVPWLEQRGFAV